MDSVLEPRLPDWIAKEPLADRVIDAMWLYLMNYRLADEEKIDETSVWYAIELLYCYVMLHSVCSTGLCTAFQLRFVSSIICDVGQGYGKYARIYT